MMGALHKVFSLDSRSDRGIVAMVPKAHLGHIP